MSLLQELLSLVPTNESVGNKKKRNKKDKSADRYPSYVAGNMLFTNVCSSSLSGDKKISTDIRQ